MSSIDIKLAVTYLPTLQP